MFRRSVPLAFSATPVRRFIVADDDDPHAPDTTFKNLKPSLFIRWVRQVKQRIWVLWVLDEEFGGKQFEAFHFRTNMEQIMFAPASSYGEVPGHEGDPLLFNTKSTSPFRWHQKNERTDIAGHWYLEFDDMMRIKPWRPKTDSPMEVPPRGPNINFGLDESIDEHGNRSVKNVFRYEVWHPSWNMKSAYPFAHQYRNLELTNRWETVEPYGFKQGEFMRANKEEDEEIRRMMEEEDLAWERVKKTELLQEPWYYPGKIRADDLKDTLKRAKERWRATVKAGRPTDPTKDPDYDLVMAGEMVEPRDGPRAEWRHLWFANRPGSTEDKMLGKDLMYSTTGNAGMSLEDVESGTAQPYPGFNEEVAGGAKYHRTTMPDGSPLHDQTKPLPDGWAPPNYPAAPPGFDVAGNRLPDWEPPAHTLSRAGEVIPNTQPDGSPLPEGVGKTMGSVIDALGGEAPLGAAGITRGGDFHSPTGWVNPNAPKHSPHQVSQGTVLPRVGEASPATPIEEGANVSEEPAKIQESSEKDDKK